LFVSNPLRVAIEVCETIIGSKSLHYTRFFKDNVRCPVWNCRDPISLILGTRFSLILGTRFSILGIRIGFLKHLKKPCYTSNYYSTQSLISKL